MLFVVLIRAAHEYGAMFRIARRVELTVTDAMYPNGRKIFAGDACLQSNRDREIGTNINGPVFISSEKQGKLQGQIR